MANIPENPQFVTKKQPFALTDDDWEKLAARYIGPEQVRLNDIYRVDDVQGAEIVSRTFSSIHGQRYCGLIIPNFRVGFLNPRTYRLRRDFPDMVPRTDRPGFKETAKYLWSKESRGVFFYPFGNKVEWMKDPTIPALFIEGEFKAIALKRVLEEAEIDALVIGLYGAHNWKGKQATGSDTTGPVNDFEDIEWKNREVTICRDANYRVNPSVAAGMYQLALHLQLLGALAYFADTPEAEGINGLDDLAGARGPGAVLEVLDARYLAIKPTITPKSKEERQDAREALRQAVRDVAATEDEYTATRRRATAADFAALSTICAEHQYSDKARVGLQALVALSDGKQSFSWRYDQLYPLLRRYDPELFKAAQERVEVENGRTVEGTQIKSRVPSKAAKKAAGKINGTVRAYLDAIDRDQARCGIELASTKRGSKHIDEKGNVIYEQSETTLPLLSYLEEIDALAKADPSYSRASKSIRAREAREVAGHISKFTPPTKPETPLRWEIEMALKRAGGNVKAAIGLMRGHNYEDWAIRMDLRKHMPAEYFEIMTGAEGLEITVEIDSQAGDTPLNGHVTDSVKDTATGSVDDLLTEPQKHPANLLTKAETNLIPKEPFMNKVSNPVSVPAPTFSNVPPGSEVSNPGAAFRASLDDMDDFEVDL